ncbi:MAG: DMT family transporter, partial [Anaerolineae bacterium]|nr:DMT family transporter [Anaerolineae bacterium]
MSEPSSPPDVRRQLMADSALVLVTIVWGTTFVMVQDAVIGFPVFAFLALRFSLAAIALWPLAGRESAGRWSDRRLWTGGLWMGLALFAGYAFQTAGLRYTTPARAGFITGMAVVLVPLGSALFLHRPPSRHAVVGVGLAAIGLALLSFDASSNVTTGDLLVMGCAVSFAAQIVLTAAFAPGRPPIRLAWVQIVTVAVLSGVITLMWERPWPSVTGRVVFAAAFTGVLATALAFAIQTSAQRFTSPTHTALI